MNDQTTTNNIDEAIARAKAQVKARMEQVEMNAHDEATSEDDVGENCDKHDEKLSKNLSDQEKALKREQKRKHREEERARRAEEREAKKRARALKRQLEKENRSPAHLTKVEKAAAKLPELDSDLDEELENLKAKYSVSQLSLLVAHLQLANRLTQTLASNGMSFEVGQQVRIVASENDPSLIGKVGTVTEMRKIRVHLDVEGHDKPAYLFAADCEPIEQVVLPRVEQTDEDVGGVVVNDEGFLTVTEDEESTGTDG